MAQPYTRPSATRRRDPLLTGMVLLIVVVAVSGWLTALSQLAPVPSSRSGVSLSATAPRPVAVGAVATATPTVAALSMEPTVRPTEIAFTPASVLPTPSAQPTSVAIAQAPPATAGGAIHVVQRGETVWGIASSYGVRHDAVLAANGLGSDAAISIGQRLVVPDR